MADIGLRFHLKPYQKPHPPIGVAGVSASSETLVTAGERGWIPMSINLVPARLARLLVSHWESVERGARSAGRTPDRSAWRIARNVYISDTTTNARREALDGVMKRDFDQYFLRLMSKLDMLDLFKIDPEMPDSDVTPGYLVDNIWIVGSADDVAEKLRKLYHDVGGFGVLLVGHEWQPRDQWVSSMTALVNDVVPRLPNVA